MTNILSTLVEIELTAKQEERLRRPIVGSGGFQGLLRHIAEQLDHPMARRGVLRITDPIWVERFYRYRSLYGEGGFEQRLMR